MGILKKYQKLEKKYKEAIAEIDILKRRLGESPTKLDVSTPKKQPPGNYRPISVGMLDMPSTIPESVQTLVHGRQGDVEFIVKEYGKYGKLETIVELRRLLGIGLKEAKDLCDFLFYSFDLSENYPGLHPTYIWLQREDGDYIRTHNGILSGARVIVCNNSKVDAIKELREMLKLTTTSAEQLYTFIKDGKLNRARG